MDVSGVEGHNESTLSSLDHSARETRNRGQQNSRQTNDNGRENITAPVESQLREEQAESEPFILNAEALIYAVQERPSLWDQSDPQHADIVQNRRLWEEIFSEIVPNWEVLPQKQKRKIGKDLQTRWRSMRDRYIRDHNEESRIPSGSGASKRPIYRYRNQLQFLQRVVELRQTSGNVRLPDEHESGAVNTAATGDAGASTSTTTVAGNSSLPISEGVSQRLGRDRSSHRCNRLIFINMMKSMWRKLEEMISSLRLQMELRFLRVEGRGTLENQSDSKLYCNSLVSMMENLPVTQRLQFRAKVNLVLQEIITSHMSPTLRSRLPTSTIRRQYHQPPYSQCQSTGHAPHVPSTYTTSLPFTAPPPYMGQSNILPQQGNIRGSDMFHTGYASEEHTLDPPSTPIYGRL
ncbi:uncharacterized protein [Dendropsophus ebraccatus]|uniref:uncharacterized protein n=1 Tax=Dendropsophus ebraccatus TaxID=150705 RepID=UPI003831FD0C